jgi:hypothetical protein
MRTCRWLAAGILLASAAGHVPASADEIFVCEGGRLVRVDVETFETLKRTDPCVARYYGLEIAAAPPPAPAAAKVSETGALPAPPPSQAARPASDTAEVYRSALAATGLVPGRHVRRGEGAAQGERAATSKPDRIDVPGDGYRTVAIINAGPGEPALYRHGP